MAATLAARPAAAAQLSSTSHNRPVVQLDSSSDTYDDLDDAATAFATKIRQPKGDSGNEQGGVIFRRPDGKYQLSAPTSGMHDAMEFAARFPQGYSIAALVHSHPTTMESGQYFSPRDIAVAKQLNVPSYIQFDKDDAIRRYTPGKTVVFQQGDVGGPGFAQATRGDPVLGQVPITAQRVQAPTATVPVNNINPLSASRT